MKKRDRTLSEFVLEAMANDYESFQCILEQVTKWSGQKGLPIQKDEVAGAVEHAIRDGYALAYSLSPQPPHMEDVTSVPVFPS
jgi:hypothetical protein